MKSVRTPAMLTKSSEALSEVKELSLWGLSLQWLAYAGAVLLLAGVLLITQVSGYSLGALVRDPNVVLDGDPLIGIQSNIGVLVWFAAAVSCFLYGACFSQIVRRPGMATFFAWSGVMTLWLVLDDFFLIHEYLPEVLPAISQPQIYVAYMLGMLAYGICFRRQLMASTGKGLAIAALIFLGLSMLSDVVQEMIVIPGRLFWEDGFKLLGIVSWSSFFIRAGFSQLSESIRSGQHS